MVPTTRAFCAVRLCDFRGIERHCFWHYRHFRQKHVHQHRSDEIEANRVSCWWFYNVPGPLKVTDSAHIRSEDAEGKHVYTQWAATQDRTQWQSAHARQQAMDSAMCSCWDGVPLSRVCSFDEGSCVGATASTCGRVANEFGRPQMR